MNRLQEEELESSQLKNLITIIKTFVEIGIITGSGVCRYGVFYTFSQLKKAYLLHCEEHKNGKI